MTTVQVASREENSEKVREENERPREKGGRAGAGYVGGKCGLKTEVRPKMV